MGSGSYYSWIFPVSACGRHNVHGMASGRRKRACGDDSYLYRVSRGKQSAVLRNDDCGKCCAGWSQRLFLAAFPGKDRLLSQPAHPQGKAVCQPGDSGYRIFCGSVSAESVSGLCGGPGVWGSARVCGAGITGKFCLPAAVLSGDLFCGGSCHAAVRKSFGGSHGSRGFAVLLSAA